MEIHTFLILAGIFMASKRFTHPYCRFVKNGNDRTINDARQELNETLIK